MLSQCLVRDKETSCESIIDRVWTTHDVIKYSYLLTRLSKISYVFSMQISTCLRTLYSHLTVFSFFLGIMMSEFHNTYTHWPLEHWYYKMFSFRINLLIIEPRKYLYTTSFSETVKGWIFTLSIRLLISSKLIPLSITRPKVTWRKSLNLSQNLYWWFLLGTSYLTIAILLEYCLLQDKWYASLNVL